VFFSKHGNEYFDFYKGVGCGCRSHVPRGLRRGSTATSILGLWVRITLGAWKSACCMSSGWCLCDGPIAHRKECYRVWCA